MLDDKKFLSDENLEQLNMINEIDLYSIVDEQFNKKSKRKGRLITFLIVISGIALIYSMILLSIVLGSTSIFNLLGYYLVSSWIGMFVLLILKSKSIKEGGI